MSDKMIASGQNSRLNSVTWTDLQPLPKIMADLAGIHPRQLAPPAMPNQGSMIPLPYYPALELA